MDNSFVADLHMHSHYANATSKNLTIPNIAKYAKIKGVDVIGTGDFTHPLWLQQIKEELSYDKNSSLYIFEENGVKFSLTSEVSLVYKDKGKTKKIHIILIAPNIEIVEKINIQLAAFGNLSLDGRPTLNISSSDFIKLIKSISGNVEIIPAHIWTPWFGVMGKWYGYDSLEDAFKDQIENIHAIETGLSSDPFMNWLSIDPRFSIVSFSDAHSLERIGRECSVFEGEASYNNILKGISENKILYTVEFFPEEGKYHFAGHRKCGVSFAPNENNDKCPVCGRKLTPGVLSRVYELGLKHFGQDHINFIEKNIKKDKLGFQYIEGKKKFIKLIPLDEIIANSLGVKGTKTKKVVQTYDEIIKEFGSELKILIDTPEALKSKYPQIFSNIKSVIEGNVKIKPGFDNTYGKVSFS